MTDIDLSEVNIHVVAVVPEKLEQPTIEELLKTKRKRMNKIIKTRDSEMALQALFH